ncbi:hypothetical protein D5F11_009955 [Siminovitchia terrae]|uniref:Uncharacterized protein n=1 Tax=Siminovitchia terrae TaxID=1914933 RepID=A0A429X997_SIMTE|nr:hypothetical protein [Siminovitchia terrae]RST60004.1 hypothetical protein D5F11_009955 [Siminovitchia terrae]
MYLLSDNKFLPGLEFIKRTGAYYDNSEYDMFLKGDLRRGLALNELRLREAVNKDAKEIARQNAVYFDVGPKKVGLTLPEEEANRGVDIYHFLTEDSHYKEYKGRSPMSKWEMNVGWR